MCLEKLRDDVFCAFPGKITVKKAVLNNGLLAEVRPIGNGDDLMIVLNQSNTDEMNYEAEAHECCHILLKCRGLVFFDFYTDDDKGYLKGRINNAISHNTLVQILKEEYSIDNPYMVQAARSHLEIFSDEISDFLNEPHILHGYGVLLYDYFNFCDNFRHDICDFSKIDRNVTFAFKESFKHLSKICFNIPKKDQIEIIRSFLKMLEYSPSCAESSKNSTAFDLKF